MKEPSFHPPVAVEPTLIFGNLRLKPDGTLLRGGAQIHLPPKELAALKLLLAHAGQVVTPSQLKATLWTDVHVTPDSISKCMSSLRARLEPEECIQTVYKRGYRLRNLVQRDAVPPHVPQPRLAIVPFVTSANVPAYFGPGIAEETLARLSNQGELSFSVLARDSTFNLVQQGMTCQQMGEALKADLVLTGKIFALPLHFRLRVEMIRVADAAQIWAEDILVRKDESPQLESELVRRLAFRLAFGVNPSSAIPTGEEHQLPIDSAAYELFLRGHQEWQAPERHRMQDGTQHLLRATEQDASFVAAQTDLILACATQSLYGFVSPASAAEQVHRVAEANPYLVEDAPLVLPVLGWMRFHVDRNLAGALETFSRCEDLPHDRSTTRMRALFALSRHRFDEALTILGLGLEADPYAAWMHAEMAWAQHLSGDAEKSLETIERSLLTFPADEWVQVYGATILAFHGKTERAVNVARELVQQKPYFDIASAVYAYALACDGHQAEARAMLERLQWLGRERFVLPSFHPAVCVALGDMQGALAELRAAELGCCPWFFQMLADPRLQPLHGNLEFEQMRAQLARMEGTISEVLEDTSRELSFAP